MIYVIGLGGNSGCLSEKALQILQNCEKRVLKTSLSASGAAFLKLGLEHITLDGIYAKSRNFDTLNVNIVKELLKLLHSFKNVAYLVDGSGYEDSSVALLFSKTKDVKIIPSVSKSNILSFYPCSSYTVFSCSDFIDSQYAEFSTENPLVIYEIDNTFSASDIKLKLFKYYDEEKELFFFNGEDTIKISIFELDRQNKYDYATSILVPPCKAVNKNRYTFGDLLRIMKFLRGKDGCPWDKVQTHESIKMNAVEESYELAEAIDNNDIVAMEEETGDVLLQTVFQSRIAEDCSEFDIYDVISKLCRKLVFRHSHIYGTDKASESEEALSAWEKNKNTEKGQDTYTKSLKGVAKTFPSIMRAEKVQKRAAKCGFDFGKAEDVFCKLSEEIAELKEAIAENNPQDIHNESGDLLFTVVNLLRKLKIDGELALTDSINKFIKRFEFMENRAKTEGKQLDEMTIEEMDVYYSESKNEN